MRDHHPQDLVARIVTDDARPGASAQDNQQPKFKTRASSRMSRAASTLVIAILSMFVLAVGVGGTQSANAFGIPGVDVVPCPMAHDSNPGPFGFLSGTTGMMPIQIPGSRQVAEASMMMGESSFGKTPHTGFEKYRTSGLVWSMYNPKDDGDNADGESGCYKITSTAANLIANMVFSLTNVLTEGTVGMYQWASSPDLLSSMNDTMDCVVGGKASGNPSCHGPGLRKSLYLDFLTPIIVLGALWGAWVGLMKKRTIQAAQGGLWMLGSALFALAFMAQPAMIAGFLNGVVSDVNSAVMVGITQQSSNAVAKQDICYLPDSAPNAGDRMAACSIWKGMAYSPWAAGQFGVPLGVPLKNTDKEKDTYPDLRNLQLEAQSISHDETLSGADADTDNDRWDSVKDQMFKTPYKQAWAGDDSSERVNIAFAAVIASIMSGALVIVVSFASVVLAVGMLLLIMMAPMFLLIGAHPGFGRGIALKWLELLIGTVVKRIALGFFLAVLIGMYQVILTTPMGWFAQIAMILAIGIGALIFRKPMLESLNVINLGGSSTGMERGLGREGRRASGMVVAAGAGALAASGSGGGTMLKGALHGAMMGARSPSPMRAARMGAGAGRRVAGRERAEDNREKKAAGAGQPTTSQADRDRAEAEAARRADDATRGDDVGPDPYAPPPPRPGGQGGPGGPGGQGGQGGPGRPGQAPARGGGGVPRPQKTAEEEQEENEVRREREESRREREATAQERREATQERRDTTRNRRETAESLDDLSTSTTQNTRATERLTRPGVPTTSPTGAPTGPGGLPTQRPTGTGNGAGNGDGNGVPRPNGGA